MLNNDVFTAKYLKYLENFKSDRYLFRMFNDPKSRPMAPIKRDKNLLRKPKKEKGPLFCSANGILRDENKDPYAVHCNCGWYHPVVYKKFKHGVYWNPEFVIRTKNSTLVKREIEKLWILQL